MNHDETQLFLEAFLDDELDVTTAIAVDKHVQSCAQCTAWLVDRRRLSARLRAAPVRYEMPMEPLSRLRRLLRQKSPRSRVFGQWPLAAAASVVLAVGGFLIGHSLPRPTELGDELISAHVRAGLSLHVVDVESSDHHTVKPWLSSQLPFSPPVPELSAQDDALLGGRVDYLDHARVAVLVYRHGKHQVDVFLWPTSAEHRPPPANAAADGYRIVGANVEGFSVALTSDMTAEELKAFAARWSAGVRNR